MNIFYCGDLSKLSTRERRLDSFNRSSSILEAYSRYRYCSLYKSRVLNNVAFRIFNLLLLNKIKSNLGIFQTFDI